MSYFSLVPVAPTRPSNPSVIPNAVVHTTQAFFPASSSALDRPLIASDTVTTFPISSPLPAEPPAPTVKPTQTTTGTSTNTTSRPRTNIYAESAQGARGRERYSSRPRMRSPDPRREHKRGEARIYRLRRKQLLRTEIETRLMDTEPVGPYADESLDTVQVRAHLPSNVLRGVGGYRIIRRGWGSEEKQEEKNPKLTGSKKMAGRVIQA
ncbi:hypothetical protein R3P38DRAFT_2788191 [Favolaschia claudopus]|uniref:Uncharacterized protein n=1 Tax=Favolaschia claudopus TaxID=2862362 RepID=A0AAW0AL91_9AGAR